MIKRSIQNIYDIFTKNIFAKNYIQLQVNTLIMLFITLFGVTLYSMLILLSAILTSKPVYTIIKSLILYKDITINGLTGMNKTLLVVFLLLLLIGVCIFAITFIGAIIRMYYLLLNKGILTETPFRRYIRSLRRNLPVAIFNVILALIIFILYILYKQTDNGILLYITLFALIFEIYMDMILIIFTNFENIRLKEGLKLTLKYIRTNTNNTLKLLIITIICFWITDIGMLYFYYFMVTIMGKYVLTFYTLFYVLIKLILYSFVVSATSYISISYYYHITRE